MAQDLQIKISADIAELKSALSQAQADIRAMGNTAQAAGAQGAAGFEKAGKAATNTASASGAAAEQTKGAFDQVKNAGDVVAVVMDKVKAGDLRGAMTAGAQGAGILTAAMRSLGVALLTNPITLAITALGALGAAAYSAITAVSGAQDKFAATADSLDKLSAQTGIAASTLQNYKGLATLTNTSIDAVAHSLGFLQRQMAGMGDDPSNNMLERLGVQSTDTTGALIETATAIEALGSDAEKTAARMGVFGRGGNEIAGFLSKVAQLGPLAGDALNGLVKTQSDSALATAAQVEALGKLGDLISEGKTNALAASTIESRKEADLASVAYSSLGGMVTTWKELTVAAGNAWAGFKTRTIEYMVDMRGGWTDLCNLFVGAWEVSTAALKKSFYTFVGAVASGLATLNSALGNTSAAAQYQAEAAAANANAAAAAAAITAGSAKVVAAINNAGRDEARAKFAKAKAAADAATKGGSGEKGAAVLGPKKAEQDGKAADKAKQLADALYQLKKAELESLQKLEDDALKTAAAAYEQAYKDGSLSIKDYYDTTYAIEKTQLDNLLALKEAELAAAKDKQAKLEALGDKAKPDAIRAKAEVIKLTADVDLAKGAEAKLAAKVDRARADAQKELDSAKLKIDIELAGLQNKDLTRSQIEQSVREGYQSALNKVREDANATQALELLIKTKVDAAELEQVFKRAKTKLDIEIELTGLQGLQLSRQQIEQSLRNQYRELFKQLENDPALTAQLNSIITIKADTQQFEQQLKDLELKNRANTQPLDAQRAQVEQQQGRGEISQPRAQAKLEVINAQQVQQLQTYLQGLETMRANMGEIAGDAEKMGKALELDAKINATKSSIEGLKPVVMDIGVELENSFANHGTAALEGFMNGTKSAKQAFADFAKSVIADIIKMIAKMLIVKAIKMAMGGFADGGAVGDGAQAFATGGSVHGAGGPRDDLIPAWLSNGEHVMDARTVQAFGGHGVFNALRAVGNGRAGANLASALPSQLLASLGNLVNLPSHAPTGGVARLANGGAAVPNLARDGAAQRPVVLTNHFTVQGSVDARSQQQIANATFNAAMRAKTRLS